MLSGRSKLRSSAAECEGGEDVAMIQESKSTLFGKVALIFILQIHVGTLSKPRFNTRLAARFCTSLLSGWTPTDRQKGRMHGDRKSLGIENHLNRVLLSIEFSTIGF